MFKKKEFFTLIDKNNKKINYLLINILLVKNNNNMKNKILNMVAINSI